MIQGDATGGIQAKAREGTKIGFHGVRGHVRAIDSVRSALWDDHVMVAMVAAVSMVMVTDTVIMLLMW